jgi:Domain of unknown function (DUF4412)
MKIQRGFLFYVVVVSVALMATIPVVAQGFTIKMKMDDGSQGTTYYVSANAIRKINPGVNDVIDRIDKGTIIYLDHRNKTYKEGSVAQAREAIAKHSGDLDPQKMAMMHRMGLDAPPEVTAIGAGENIAGYPTEKYAIKTGMAEGELWITQSLQFPDAYYRDFNLLAGVQTPFGDMGKIAQVHGVVLKRTMRMKMANGSAVTEVAVSVEKGNVPASMFQPPAEYQNVTTNRGGK